jgi:hypothetical protein
MEMPELLEVYRELNDVCRAFAPGITCAVKDAKDYPSDDATTT